MTERQEKIYTFIKSYIELRCVSPTFPEIAQSIGISCLKTVRRNMEEMRELVRQMERAALPHTCPHGRPTMMVIPRGRLGRQFGRT